MAAAARPLALPPPGDALVARLIRASFDGAPDGLVIVSRGGQLLACNAAFERLWGFPAAMLARGDAAEMRRHTAGLVADPQAYLASLAALATTDAPQLFDEVRLVDGRLFERHVAPTPVPGCDDALVVRWRDVTARHRAEQELAALMDLAMMDADLVFWDADLRAGRMTSVNSHWHTMLGYRRDEVPDTLEAWDALVHPDDAAGRILAWEAHLLGSTSVFECEFRIRHKLGHWLWMQARGRVVERAADGEPLRVTGLRQNITRRKATEARLEGLAHTDALTGVNNRRRFTDLASDELARAQRHGQPVALLMIDLDHFKSVNDRLGHAGGDAVLRSFAATADGVMRQGDIFGRVGGEEFAALLPQTTLDGAEVLAERLRQRIAAQPAAVGDGVLPFSVSIGVSAWLPGDADAADIDRLMVAADRALYAAKAQGRDRVLRADRLA